MLQHVTSRRRQFRQPRDASSDPLADACEDRGVSRYEHVHSRAELHDPEPIAGADVSPAFTRQTIRRASTPTIWRTTMRWPVCSSTTSVYC